MPSQFRFHPSIFHGTPYCRLRYICLQHARVHESLQSLIASSRLAGICNAICCLDSSNIIDVFFVVRVLCSYLVYH